MSLKYFCLLPLKHILFVTKVDERRKVVVVGSEEDDKDGGQEHEAWGRNPGPGALLKQ